MAFDPAVSVPGSTASDWTFFQNSDSTNSNVTTYYHPATGTMVDYDNARNTFVEVAPGTPRRSGIEAAFASRISRAQQNLTTATVTANATTTGSAILSSQGISQSGNRVPRPSYPTSYYPDSLRTTKQDRIKFEMRTAGTRNLPSQTNNLQAFTPRTTGARLGEVYLAVPNQISDSNSADWSSATMTPLQMQLASLALGGMKDSSTNVADMLSNLAGKAMKNLKDFAASSGNREALQVYLAQEASGAQGLLSRLGGVVANPNVELLFNGPSLRPFTFSFRMAPRSSLEAEQVKRIIRFFKEGMAVQTTDQDIFLKSPNVFNIQFQSGSDNSPHKSLPRIKTCALIGCDVDYTPDGSYMTFDDEQKGYPMTCYQMTLRFNEIEPVYAADYRAMNADDDIGY